MSDSSVLTIDIGTTAIKFSLYQGKNLIEKREARIQTYTGENGKIYQKPEEILTQLKAGITAFSKLELKSIATIALSTAMHSLLPVFKDGSYGELLLWSDSQAAASTAAFKKLPFSREVYQKTGTPIHYMSPFSKLLYFKQQDILQNNVGKWIGLKELVVSYFTGSYCLDYSTASATGLFNSLDLDWDQDILSYVSIEREQLAELIDTDVLLPIQLETKQQLGLASNVQLLAGASDGCLAAYAGYLNTGLTTSITLGTSGAVRQLTNKRQLDKNGQTFCYYLKKDLWVIGGPSNNGGAVLEWVSNLFWENPTTLFDHLNLILKETSIGADGLTFLPFINGERAPFWNSFFKGSFQNITMTHNRKHFVRAAAEGILLNLRMIMDANQIEEDAVSINGGAFRHEELAKLAGAIFGKDCLLSTNNEPGFGLLSLAKQTFTAVPFTSFQRIKKNNELASAYQDIYENFLTKIEQYKLQQQEN
ncbi:gluconokinase [Enterococcus sp. LJL128]